MYITAEAVPVYLALIGLATLIVQSVVASRQRGRSEQKLDQIHTLTNSGMAEVRSQLSTALARIEELNKAATAAAAAAAVARVPMMPPLPEPPPVPGPVLVR